MFDFKDQVVIVTGGTRGIGRAVSEGFLKSGANVIATYAANEQKAEEFRDENSDHGIRIDLQKFSIADYEQVENFYARVEKKYGSIHVLVNNAGIRKDALLGMMSARDWKAVIDVNLTGTFYMTKFAVKNMLRERYGRIITMTSVMSGLGFKGQSNYAASKAGQIAMTVSLAKEVGSYGITANCVSPGFVSTEFIQDLKSDVVEKYKKLIPIQEFATPEQIAYGVLFLASKEASYINGTTLPIHGGL